MNTDFDGDSSSLNDRMSVNCSQTRLGFLFDSSVRRVLERLSLPSGSRHDLQNGYQTLVFLFNARIFCALTDQGRKTIFDGHFQTEFRPLVRHLLTEKLSSERTDICFKGHFSVEALESLMLLNGLQSKPLVLLVKDKLRCEPARCALELQRRMHAGLSPVANCHLH